MRSTISSNIQSRPNELGLEVEQMFRTDVNVNKGAHDREELKRGTADNRGYL